MVAATLHVFMEDMPLSKSAGVKARIQTLLRDRYQITHTNIQVEAADADCDHREGIKACKN
jgi:hypothetical protein